MSWYFFGGFSAYAMEPSARCANHSGWSATQGWSGEACSAKSSATSRPSDFALATNASKSSNVPRSGWMASWPPSTFPIAQGDPGSAGPGFRVLFGPLRNDVPMGWIGGGTTKPQPNAAVASSPSYEGWNVPDVQVLVASPYTAPCERG